MLIVILAGLNTLRLSVASELFNQIKLYITNVIVAVLALISGVFLAGFIAQVVSTNLSFLFSLTQLSIGEKAGDQCFLLLFGAACWALPLA